MFSVLEIIVLWGLHVAPMKYELAQVSAKIRHFVKKDHKTHIFTME